MAPISKLCRITSKPFEISNLEQEICSKVKVPLPTISPGERLRRLSAFNNYLNIFPGKCAATGEKILTMFRPEAPFPVYSVPHWWGESWDAATFARDYIPENLFFDQMLVLRNLVPMPALSINYSTLENCEYVNGSSFSKNCYLSFLCVHCEDCLFCFNIRKSRDCTDCSSVYECELCHDCTFAAKCYNLRHSFSCRGCSDSSFLIDCIGCKNCFASVGLRQSEYVFLNEQLTRETYEARLKMINFDDFNQITKWKEIIDSHSKKYQLPKIHGFHLEEADGDFLERCKNVERSFDCSSLEDSANCMLVDGGSNCMDMYTWGASSELVYCCSRAGTNVSKIKFSFITLTSCSNLEYCIFCINCSDCFGCVGLRNKKFHILNKEYSEKDYYTLRSKIIAQMSAPNTPVDERYGEFFPYRLSMFAYNDSDAMLFFPAEEKEILPLGATWADKTESSNRKTDSWDGIPARTRDISDEILNKTFSCMKTGYAFKITKSELQAYRQRMIPLPRVHWLERIRERHKPLLPKYN